MDAKIEIRLNNSKAIKLSKEFDGYEIKHEELTLIMTEEQVEELFHEINKVFGRNYVETLEQQVQDLTEINENQRELIEEQEEQFKELMDIAESKGVAL